MRETVFCLVQTVYNITQMFSGWNLVHTSRARLRCQLWRLDSVSSPTLAMQS